MVELAAAAVTQASLPVKEPTAAVLCWSVVDQEHTPPARQGEHVGLGSIAAIFSAISDVRNLGD